MPESHIYLAYLISLSTSVMFCAMASSTVQQPQDREDMIGQYKVTNEQQCQRLCWYRQLCSRYSFLFSSSEIMPSSAEVRTNPANCVLHTDSVTASSAYETVYPAMWKDAAASNAHIKNGCRSRPCTESEVCVPTVIEFPSQIIETTSYACLSLPAQCGIFFNPVRHAQVRMSGSSQDDVAIVTCDDGYVASPRNVSLEIRCLITSVWTKFQGVCMKYEFRNPKNKTFSASFPRILNEVPGLCFKGVYMDVGQMYFDFFVGPGMDTYLHVTFRYQFFRMTGVYCNIKDNVTWLTEKKIGEMPLLPGDSFSITVRVLKDSLLFVLNTANNYTIFVSDFQIDNKQINVNDFTGVFQGGMGNLTYVNLISEC